MSTRPNPAAASISDASSVPHIRPRAAPPSASDVVVQYIRLVAYPRAASGSPMLRSSLLENFVSTMTKTPSGESGDSADEPVDEVFAVDRLPGATRFSPGRLDMCRERRTRHPAAFRETPLQLGQGAAETTQHRRDPGHVRRRLAGQEPRMRQGVSLVGGVVGEDPAGGHR